MYVSALDKEKDLWNTYLLFPGEKRKSFLLQEDLVCEYIPALKGKKENYIRNLCILK